MGGRKSYKLFELNYAFNPDRSTEMIVLPKSSRGLVVSFIFIASSLLLASDAFVTPSQKLLQAKTVQSKTSLHKRLAKLEESYGEQSRMYRRDQFSYEKWVRHRANTRWVSLFYDAGVVRSGLLVLLLASHGPTISKSSRITHTLVC